MPLRQPAIDAARAAGATVIGELELASRWLSGRIVAITGTKGKSTTTTLAGRMLEAGGLEGAGRREHRQRAERAGRALDPGHDSRDRSEQLPARRASRRFIRGWRCCSISRPTTSIVTPTVEEYAAAKGRIFENQVESDWVVLNADDPAVAGDRAQRSRAAPAGVAGTRSSQTGSASTTAASSAGPTAGRVPLVPLTSVRLLGRHLLTDVMAAAAVAHLAGVSAGGDDRGGRRVHRASSMRWSR